ncbi:GAF domain-containing protein [Zobellia sp. 1_MG-2023]|uniref:GAF domain-containing protein n=1 Tax=Zobellia sp. 1_MG-2023 TaxID=3062626 RepID=UPI0026E4150D|nr:GAF domain-containing protein [Zobellia sp. 1_MG-2023]MDO6820252.1 GAF domain-containing protein [Zobellia sp. 1_MG-2023]
MSDKQELTVDRILTDLRLSTIDWQQVLENVISVFDCSTGTLHFLDQKTELLQLQAQKGIPPFLIPKLTTIPVGKGMAGIAAERKEAVEMCNLQTDDSGVARPAAKETKVEGSIAAPMLFDGKLYGTLGIAKPVPYDFTEDERNSLLKIGEAMSKALVG